MAQSLIQVQNLTKTYRVPVRPEGLAASVRSLLHPQYNHVTAVQDVSFSIEEGAMVGLIGPNGAGKTTTLKMLSGLLHPTSGSATVAGFVPWQRHPDYLRRISMVMGNKSQMLWDIPPMDSFRVLSEIYDVPPAEFRRTLDELIALLDLQDLLSKPVRTLSLGERMKCELTASLLHRPAVLFLDEPTLGLDVSMQLRLRSFLAGYNQRSGVTVILTSHYMADVMALCPRVILIHKGRLLHDGALEGLARQLLPFKMVHITLDSETFDTGNLPFILAGNRGSGASADSHPAGNGGSGADAGLLPAGNAGSNADAGLLPAGNAGSNADAGLLPAGNGESGADAGLLPAGSAGSNVDAGSLPAGNAGSTAGAGSLPAGNAGSNADAGSLPAGSAGSNVDAGSLPAGSAGSNVDAGSLLAGNAGSNVDAGLFPAGSAGSTAGAGSLPAGVEVMDSAAGSFTLRVPRSSAAAVTAWLLRELPITDLSVTDPPIEAVIDQVYSDGAE